MFIFSKQLRQLPVISLQTGQRVATTTEPIVSPSLMAVVALHCDSVEKADQPVITVQDVRQLARDAVIINSADQISEAGDIIRLQQLLADGFKLIGLATVTESGQRLGKVEEFTVELGNWAVKKIHVKPPLWKSLVAGSLIIDRNQVVEASRKQLVVSDAWVKDPMLAAVPKPIK